MHVTIKSLKVFCDIVGRRSFSRAADENEISQSGASQIVHQLEQHLGVRLLDRSKRPFELTEEGELFYDGGRKLVQRYAALEEEVRTLNAEVAGRVRVASIYSVGLSRLSSCVQEFLQRHSKSNIRVEYAHPAAVYELVESDQAELGLVSYPKSSRAIRVLPWREEPMALVCAPNHRLAGRASISLKELDGERLVGFDGELPIRREIDRELAAHGVEAEVVLEFDNIETIKRAIEINSGVGLLPLPTVEREVQFKLLTAIPLADSSLTRPVGIIHRVGQALGPTTQRFVEFLQEYAEPHAGSDVALASVAVRDRSPLVAAVNPAAGPSP